MYLPYIDYYYLCLLWSLSDACISLNENALQQQWFRLHNSTILSYDAPHRLLSLCLIWSLSGILRLPSRKQKAEEERIRLLKKKKKDLEGSKSGIAWRQHCQLGHPNRLMSSPSPPHSPSCYLLLFKRRRWIHNLLFVVVCVHRQRALH